MPISSIREIIPHIRAAGLMALELQRSGTLHASLKADGTIVTQADTQVEDLLYDKLTALYPEVNILTEETAHAFDPQKRYTFALDPVDGTEVFSRGLAGWCVALGLLDQSLQPIAGAIYAPCVDMMLVADVGQEVTLNGRPLHPSDQALPLSENSHLFVTSRIHRLLDLRRFPGKIRSLGSAELHLSLHLLYPDIVGGIQMPLTHIWDVAAAHALCRAAGLRIEYYDGREIDYSVLVGGGIAEDVLLAGSAAALQALRATLPRAKENS